MVVLVFTPLSVMAQAEANAAGVIQVTDFENREITLSQPPQHIGALGQFISTDIIFDGADKVAAMMALGYTKWFDEIIRSRLDEYCKTGITCARPKR